MKAVIIHGDDNNKSYQELQKYIYLGKEKGFKIYYLDKNKNESIINEINKNSLFSEKIVYVLKDINLFNKNDLRWINKNNKKLDIYIIIYSNKTINKSVLKHFSGFSKTIEFKLPKLIWSFLDSFFPGNQINFIKIYKEILKKENPEMVFYFLVRHLKDLYMVGVEGETNNYPPWRVNKLKNQFRKFGKEKLMNLISNLGEIDVLVKTTNNDLKDQLDLLFLTQLQ